MIKKEITFIVTDNVEKQCCEPVALEAEKRGYRVKFTNNKFEKCEIGYYLSHLNFPQYSKFSIVTLHDLGQQHGYWPNMWQNEFWSQYDIGLLPSKEWADMWHDSSKYDFVRPRKGCYLAGWMKSDATANASFEDDNDKIIEEYGINKNRPTILYAPSWEWDNRELEIVNAVKDLDVNLVIKQFPATPEVMPLQYKEITAVHEKVRALKQSNVYILDSKINIFNCIALCDVLVSEESSTLYEAMLLGKPVIAVDDWLVPDVNPPRLPEFPYNWAIHTKKENLLAVLNEVISNKSYEEEILKFRDSNFPNIGNSAKIVMDIIDNALSKASVELYRISELPLEPTPEVFKKSVKNRKKAMKRYILKIKVIEKSRFLQKLFNIYKEMRNR